MHEFRGDLVYSQRLRRSADGRKHVGTHSASLLVDADKVHVYSRGSFVASRVK